MHGWEVEGEIAGGDGERAAKYSLPRTKQKIELICFQDSVADLFTPLHLVATHLKLIQKNVTLQEARFKYGWFSNNRPILAVSH